ncbi:SCAN domain-containing protein 3-like [Mytilus edulis]|uniref:SCAN domain-containing protein 3-like n=1 Tax=Mytilus edulis TaxID=6550 RepID=UPI0039EE16DA
MWPELVIVHGKPRHPQSQGSIERSNGDIHDMLTTWLRDNESTKWSIGIKFVQIQKNSALNKGIGRSPYEALFGKCATIGLTSETKIPTEILMTLEKEEDLLKLQTESLNDQPVTENKTENIVDAFDIPESIAEPNVEPSTPITDETQKDVLQCYVCEKDTSGAHMCIKCDKHIHVICGTTVSEEGYGSKVVCPNCKIDTNRVRHRSGAMDSQMKQANTMIARSKKELGTAEVGQTVAVPIPMFDRGKGDSRNLLGRVIEVNDKGKATRFGQLLGTFGTNEMGICKQNLILEEEINCETTLSVREAATHQSLSGGQGFFKCYCKTKCLSNRCKCKKNGRKCNSRCHSSTTCDNK